MAHATAPEREVLILRKGLGGPHRTRHAVVALQKVDALGRDGVVGPATRTALDAATKPVARSTSGLVVEIDLARQVLMIVCDGQVESIFDTSTGRVGGTTPGGHWQVTR